MKKRLFGVRNTAFCLFAVFLLLLLLRNASVAMDGVRRGLSLCTEALLPSLFPFLVLSELLIAMGAGDLFGRFFARPISFLFGVSRNAAAPILLGTLCGQPVATTTALTAYDRGSITRAELERVTLFANNPSSGFLIGAVGAAMFGCRSAGTALFFITLGSGAIVGILLRILGGSLAKKESKRPLDGVQKTLSSKDFTTSVRRALSTFFQIAAFLLFFACLAQCLAEICQAWAVPIPIRVAILGVMEITTGISTAVTTLPSALAFRFCAFFAGFAGLSVCLQILAITEGKGVRLLPYLGAKLAQGAIAWLLASLYLHIGKPDFAAVQSVSVSAAPVVSPVFLLPCICLLAAVFLAKQKKKA